MLISVLFALILIKFNKADNEESFQSYSYPESYFVNKTEKIKSVKKDAKFKNKNLTQLGVVNSITSLQNLFGLKNDKAVIQNQNNNEKIIEDFASGANLSPVQLERLNTKDKMEELINEIKTDLDGFSGSVTSIDTFIKNIKDKLSEADDNPDLVDPSRNAAIIADINASKESLIETLRENILATIRDFDSLKTDLNNAIISERKKVDDYLKHVVTVNNSF